MDEVNATRDRIYETMDEVFGLERTMHATRNGIDLTQSRVVGSDDDKCALDHRILLNHGFKETVLKTVYLIHGFN